MRTAGADGPIASVLAEMFGEDEAESWARRLEVHDVPFELVE